MDKTIYVPPGFNVIPMLKELNRARLLGPEGAEYRREVCRNNPLLFAFIYFINSLRSKQTQMRLSLNQLHIDLAREATHWNQSYGMHERRKCWVAPRGAAKSTWLLKILVIWAAAFGHVEFILFFSDGGKMAERHLASIKKALNENELLRNDFPELCAVARRAGNISEGDNATTYKSAAGVTIMALGMDAKSLGAKDNDARPDLLLFDDIEPSEDKYSMEMKDKRLLAMIEKCFAMNPDAIVQIAGTVTMFGSIIHDLVRAYLTGELEPWIVQENIDVHYYPAIMTDKHGVEYSMWPERWKYEDLAKMRESGSATYAKNYDNNPKVLGGGEWFQKSHFKYDAPFQTAKMILQIDPAVTSHSKSDFTAFAIVSTNRAEDRCVVEDAFGVRLSPSGIRKLMLEILARNAYILQVRVERNNGGDTWAEILRPLPRGVELITNWSAPPKTVRISQLLDYMQRSWVYLRRPIPGFEGQALHYHPKSLHDDVVDAVAMGCHYFLEDNLVAVS